MVYVGVYPFIQYGILTFVDDALNSTVYEDKYPGSALDLKLDIFFGVSFSDSFLFNWFEVNWLDDSTASSNIHHAYDSIMLN